MHEKPLILIAAPHAFLERIEARVKLLCMLTWVICVVTVPLGQFAATGAYAAILAALLATNHRLIGKFARRFGPAVPMIVLFCVLLPFFKPGEVVWRWGWLTASREGLHVAARVGSAATLCVGAVALLWASTPQEGLLVGLRGIGVPNVFVGVMRFMVRYLDVLRPELHRLADARAARRVGPGGPGRVRSGANVVGTLFLRAHARAERVADAMAARGFTGELRTFQHAHFHTRDVVAIVVFPAAVILLRLLLGGA